MFFENFIITVIFLAAAHARNKSPLLDDDNTRVVNKAAGGLPSRNHIKTYIPAPQPKSTLLIKNSCFHLSFSTRVVLNDKLSLSREV